MCLADAKSDDFDPSYEIVKFYLFFEKWRRAEVDKSEHFILNLKTVCVSF